jgi:hypothetical protein
MLCAQTALLPLRDVRPGMRGVGKTVFSGDRIEEFQVEILGVLDNAGPRQSIILGRLSGGPLAHSGVLQGMSGSPVYIDGKLAGAVALAFAFSKEPIAGIRPIEEMMQPRTAGMRARTLDELARSRREIPSGGSRLSEIATPLSLAGFTNRTIEHFLPQFRTLGLEPMQGALGGSRTSTTPRGATRLAPGAMISVQLMTGDQVMSADGTITHIDGNRVYAFGHRFLSIGSTEMPFSRAEVLTLLPNLSQSFKISRGLESVGSITTDHTAAIAGEIGRKARMVPLTVSVKGRERYQMEIVRDRLLTPFLVQVATFSALDATERLTGPATVAVDGTLEFEKSPPVAVRNVYAAETAAPAIASLAGAIPLSYALQSGFPEFDVKRVTLEISEVEEKKQLQVQQLWASRNTVRPGDAADLHITLSGPGGQVRRQATWHVPGGARPGPVQVTVLDATATNLTDYAFVFSQPPSSADRVRDVLNGLRANDTLTLRVTSGEPTYILHGQAMPDLPPSLALVLRRAPAGALLGPASKIAEFDFRVDGFVVSGTRSVQLEIKE